MFHHQTRILTLCWHSAVAVQSLSPVWLFATPWTAAHQASLSFRISQFAQTHVHWVGDPIQPSHSLSSPPPPGLNLSQHEGLFQGVSSSHQVAKVLELHGMGDLNSLTRGQTRVLCVTRWSPDHWTTREAPRACASDQQAHSSEKPFSQDCLPIFSLPDLLFLPASSPGPPWP